MLNSDLERSSQSQGTRRFCVADSTIGWFYLLGRDISMVQIAISWNIIVGEILISAFTLEYVFNINHTLCVRVSWVNDGVIM